MNRYRLFVALAVALTAAIGSTLAVAGTGNGTVLVPKRQPVQIAVVIATDPALADFAVGIRNAINMAVSENPTIRGFPVQLNEFSGPCLVGDAVALNAAAADAVVANTQNVAVVGHLCSYASANTVFPYNGCDPLTNNGDPSALSIYETAGIVTINGSTTNPCLPLIGPTVFNATYVPQPPDSGAWYAAVQALPNHIAWSAAYTTAFGASPPAFADTYYDATKLLLRRLQQASKIKNGNLVIDRAALAAAVRNTTNFCGATGNLSLASGGFRIDNPTSC